MTSLNWGSVPDWLAAFGTVSAVCLALALAHRDGKRLKEERLLAQAERMQAAEERALFREQQAAEAEERKRRLASRVSLEVQPYSDPAGIRRIRWTVRNGSEQPITMVSVIRRALPLEEGGEVPLPMIYKTWTTIEPGGSRIEDALIYDQNNMREGELQFTDGNGVRWQRLEFGALRPITSTDPDGLGTIFLQR